MRIEYETQRIPLYDFIENEFGKIVNTQYIGENEVVITIIFASEGCRFVRKSDNALLGKSITLGSDEPADNYF